MKDADAAEVKRLVTVGAVVHIKQDSAPFRELSHGMTGSDVMRVQKLLIQLGGYSGAVDGIYGDATEAGRPEFPVAQQAQGRRHRRPPDI